MGFPPMSFSNRLTNVKDRVVESFLATSYRPLIACSGRPCRRTQDVASYISTARFGTSLRISSSRSTEVRGGGVGKGADSARLSGIAAMQTYPPGRAIYSQSTTAKYASMTRMTQAMTSRVGTTRTKAIGNETAVVATLKAVRCASPVQILTANTGPERSREKVTAAEIALNTSSPSRTANMQASESNQFNIGHTMQINPARGRKRTKARP